MSFNAGISSTRLSSTASILIESLLSLTASTKRWMPDDSSHMLLSKPFRWSKEGGLGLPEFWLVSALYMSTIACHISVSILQSCATIEPSIFCKSCDDRSVKEQKKYALFASPKLLASASLIAVALAFYHEYISLHHCMKLYEGIADSRKSGFPAASWYR